MKNIPNILTVFRLILVPIFVIVYFSEMQNANIIALLIYGIAAITDMLDGYIAKKYNLITDVGVVLDPLADKIMLISVIICLYITNNVPLLILLIIGVKEIFMIFTGSLLFIRKERIIIPSNIFGKIATVLLTFCIAFILIFPNNKEIMYLLYITVFIKILALVSYSRIYKTKNKSL